MEITISHISHGMYNIKRGLEVFYKHMNDNIGDLMESFGRNNYDFINYFYTRKFIVDFNSMIYNSLMILRGPSIFKEVSLNNKPFDRGIFKTFNKGYHEYLSNTYLEKIKDNDLYNDPHIMFQIDREQQMQSEIEYTWEMYSASRDMSISKQRGLELYLRRVEQTIIKNIKNIEFMLILYIYGDLINDKELINRDTLSNYLEESVEKVNPEHKFDNYHQYNEFEFDMYDIFIKLDLITIDLLKYMDEYMDDMKGSDKKDYDILLELKPLMN
jgi:hypothetical protein